MLSAADLLGLDARSPIALRHMLLGAPDEEELIRAVGRDPEAVPAARAGGRSPARSRPRAQPPARRRGRAADRLLDLDARIQRRVPWAWLDLGSAARREFTLASDQDNALAYADAGARRRGGGRRYFERLGSDVNDGLVRCGIGVDNNGVLAGKPLWRMSKDAWLRTFDDCLTEPDESHLIRATVSFDFRPDGRRAGARRRADRHGSAPRGSTRSSCG